MFPTYKSLKSGKSLHPTVLHQPFFNHSTDYTTHSLSTQPTPAKEAWFNISTLLL